MEGKAMKGKGMFLLMSVLPPLLMAVGGIIYAITAEMSTLPLTLIWVGLLMLLVHFYTYFPEIRRFITKRSTRYAFNTVLMSVVFLMIVGLIGVMSVKYKVRVDLTEDGRYTLSPQTIKILKSLKNDMEAIAFYRSDERTRQAMYDLLGEYAYYSPKFTFRFVDPDRNPAEAVKYGITSYRTTLLNYGDKKEVVGTESESRLTNAIIRLISDEVKTIYFVKGHGEKNIDSMQNDGYGLIKEIIEKENHRVRELVLTNVEHVPDDAAVIVISGPRVNFLQGELDKISEYINKGGRALFMLDPGSPAGLSDYLAGYGFELGGDLIIDKLSQVYGANYLTPVVVEYHEKHPVTRDFEVATFFPAARSVHIKEVPEKGSFDLAKTSENSWSITGELNEENLEFDRKKHKQGPINVVSVTAVEISQSPEAEKAEQQAGNIKKWGKIVVTGDSDFPSNTHMKLAGNKDFFLNMLYWLAEENVLISIRKKEPGLTPVMLTAAQGKFVFWLSVIIVPSLVLMAGIGVTARRRRGV